jgi:hypothetical protein
MFKISVGAALTFFVLLVTAGLQNASAQADNHDPSELIGTWRGTSTCSDRVAAPACRDEVVIYDFTAGAKSGTVHWKGDKVVDNQRQTMGEFELVYDREDKCWAASFSSPTARSTWCLKVSGRQLTGTLRLLPDKAIVRRIQATKH